MAHAPVYTLPLTQDQLGKYVLLAGDPGRIPIIASNLANAQRTTEARGFMVWTGNLDGELVSAASTGIGGPSAAVLLEELISLGAHTFIRLGTCGSLQKNVEIGDFVIPTAAIRDEGTTRQYVPIEVPAVASHDLVQAITSAATRSGLKFHAGLVHCKDAFYSELPELTANPSLTASKWKTWENAGALATEMETAVIFILAQLRRCRAGALLAVVGSTLEGDLVKSNPAQIESLAATGVEATRIVIADDRASALKEGKTES